MLYKAWLLKASICLMCWMFGKHQIPSQELKMNGTTISHLVHNPFLDPSGLWSFHGNHQPLRLVQQIIAIAKTFKKSITFLMTSNRPIDVYIIYRCLPIGLHFATTDLYTPILKFKSIHLGFTTTRMEIPFQSHGSSTPCPAQGTGRRASFDIMERLCCLAVLGWSAWRGCLGAWFALLFLLHEI